MIYNLKRYLEVKGLELNAGKSKIMRFRKGGGRERKVVWRWRGKKIEEVREIKYLRFMYRKNGGREAQVRERREQRLWDKCGKRE